jgi:hypothetical protein
MTDEELRAALKRYGLSQRAFAFLIGRLPHAEAGGIEEHVAVAMLRDEDGVNVSACLTMLLDPGDSEWKHSIDEV